MKIRARLAAALAVLSIGAGVVAVEAQPVSAAASATVCVRSPGGGGAGAGIHVRHQVYYEGDWYDGYGRFTGNNSCVTFPYNGADRNYFIRYKVDSYHQGFRLVSAPSLYVSPGNSSYNITLYAGCYGTCAWWF